MKRLFLVGRVLQLYAIVVLLILCSASWAVDAGSIELTLTLYFMLAVVSFHWERRNGPVLDRTITVTYLLIILFALHYWLRGLGNEYFYGVIFIKLVCAFAAARALYGRNSEILSAFGSVFAVTAVVSLLLHILFVLKPDIAFRVPGFLLENNTLDRGKEIITVAGINYYTINTRIVAEGLPRLQSFFWEPAMYGIFLVAGLFIESITKRRAIILMVLLMNLVLVFSIGTAVVISVAFLAHLMSRTPFLWLKFSKPLIAGFIVVTTLTVGLSIYTVKKLETADLKFLGRNIASDPSARVRFGDAYYPLLAMRDDLLLGKSDLRSYRESTREGASYIMPGISNSVTGLYYTFGLIIASVYLYLMYTSRLIFGYRNHIFAVWLVMLMLEPVIFSPLIMFIMLV